MIILLSAAAAAASSPMCAKLSRQFDTTEFMWAASHDLDSALLDADRKFYASSQNAVERLKLEKREKELSDSDVKAAQELDRVFNYMVAYKCDLPDHVHSWFTYSKANPKARVYKKE